MITTSYCSKTPLTIFLTFKTVYRALKSVNQPSIMEKDPILHICRPAWCKIDSYIPKQETFCELSGERRLCIITTYFIWETFRFFSVSFHSSLWSWRMIFESGHRGRTGFWWKSWTPDYFESGKVKFLKIIKTDSVINVTRAYTEIFPNADTKKRQFLPTKDR